ncbi:hypothetical protein P175DRAFT_0159393 [Aspergillus ochraceoroseus IBT 24754]|uniref:Uncharacterized protein n=1 Tax=Aspergillus ochraceoroseus IBT 24754 TaxID=1392256 RepID=A0A2T5M3P1_9EURO|nr:uncharacterized protein P175DRAFT_0159393 [Aspergillus ochraceoroseus IBT 24754]PTU23132.1 hypothetical protein P175DRAFT_0159393 [Aspergillus ochraceoroseus IBT 24754]
MYTVVHGAESLYSRTQQASKQASKHPEIDSHSRSKNTLRQCGIGSGHRERAAFGEDAVGRLIYIIKGRSCRSGVFYFIFFCFVFALTGLLDDVYTVMQSARARR